MNLNFWPKMYYSGGGGGGGSGGGGGGAAGGGASGGAGGGYAGGAGAGGAGGSGGGAAGEQAPEEPTPVGSFRFNTDTAKLEYYDGNQWVNVTTDSPEQNTGGTRAISAGGIINPFSLVNTIEFVNIDTTGDAQDFGDLVSTNRSAASAADRSRMIVMGGSTPGTPNGDVDIEKITIASTGNAVDFGGDLVTGVRGAEAVNDGTRAVCVRGEHSAGDNIMQYVTIQTGGNAVDFGDSAYAISSVAKMSSPTRGVTGGRAGGTEIEYITISTLGDAAHFGDQTVMRRSSAGTSNSVRGIIFAGLVPSPATYHQSMDVITLATLGNATEFGDMVTATSAGHSAAASPTRACVFQGRQSAAPTTLNNSIEFVNFASLGNAQDFGDPFQNKRSQTTTSNGHGGLG